MTLSDNVLDAFPLLQLLIPGVCIGDWHLRQNCLGACHLLLGLTAIKHTCPIYNIWWLAMIEGVNVCVCDSGAGVGEHL